MLDVVEEALQVLKEQTMNHKAVAVVEHPGKATDMVLVRYEEVELDLGPETG